MSRPFGELVDEVREQVADGVREVTLLGRTSTPTGATAPERRSFAELLEALDGVEGLERIRYTSPHPQE